jgi:hypothetical protein
MIPPIEKTCYVCKETKLVSEFYRSNTRYFQRECKKCNRDRKYAWHHTESGKRSSANTKLKRRFGVTIEEYEKLLESVGGKCEICGAINSDNGHRLGIDHDHETGKIRGILCKACNVGIARLQDDPYIMQKAIEYTLRSYDKTQSQAPCK